MDKKMQRVEIGVGAFHNLPKSNYSEETRNLIKVLMEESKLTMMQRKTIQRAVQKGESLPALTPIPKVEKEQIRSQAIYPSVWKKRSMDMIINSGVYEREQFRRTAPLINKEKQKRHLACMMAYGKDMPSTPNSRQVLQKNKTKEYENTDSLFDEIIEGIRERMEFLYDMECLGLGKKYKHIIHQEIAQKLRQIESIDKLKFFKFNKEIGKLINERPPPKPFPLGELEE